MLRLYSPNKLKAIQYKQDDANYLEVLKSIRLFKNLSPVSRLLWVLGYCNVWVTLTEMLGMCDQNEEEHHAT